MVCGERPTVADEAKTPNAGPSGMPSSETSRDDSAVAIALHQEAGRSGGPRITAKGRGAVADQILTIAFERGVKVRTDADLAEILAAVEVDYEVPLEALAAVAEILSYVYRANSPAADGSTANRPLGNEATP